MKKVVVGLGVVAIAGVAGYYGLNDHATAKAKENLDNAITQFEAESNGEITYESVSVNPFSKVAVIENINFKGADGTTGTVESVEVTGMVDKKTIPDNMSIQFDNIRLDDQAQFKEMKKEFPFVEEFIVDFGLQYSFDEKTGVHTSSISGGVEELFAFEGGVDLGNIADVWNEMKLAAKEEREFNSKGVDPASITIENLNFTMFDNGVMNGLVEMQAEKEGVTVEEIRSQALEEFDRSRQVPESIKPELRKIVAGQATEMKVTLTPKEAFPVKAVPMLAFVPNKERIIDELNITVKAK
jgi:hypothetical protein